jgi:tripartite-type tricarboxylate transporter receptor subunit TctC
MTEAGLPGVETTAWNGILVPAGTPRAIVDRLNSEIVRILNRPDVRGQFASQGAEAGGTSSAEFAEFIRREIEKWGKVVRAAGLTAN